MYNEENNNGSNNGNKGKFSERLKKMRRDRLKIKKDGVVDDDTKFTLMDVGRNILKVILVIPMIVYTNIKYNDKDKKDDRNVKYNNRRINDNSNLDRNIDMIVDKNNLGIDNYNVLIDKNLTDTDRLKQYKVNKIRNMDVSLLRKNREYILRNASKFVGSDVGKNIDEIDIQLKKEKLQKEIINLIKKRLVKSINELEVLQSELYVLQQLSNGDIYLDDCKEDVKKIKKLLSKVNTLKEKYDYLKDNVDFEYMLEYGDDLLVDKILELKEICSNSDIKQTIDDYKILDEYKYLYLKIDKLQDNMIKYEEYKDVKAEELRQRDIDFDIMKDKLYDVDRDNDRYNDFVRNQEIFLRELNDKIDKIDSYEKVSYRLKGFNQLLGNSFKYLGLMLVNPLKGVVPGLASQTLITKNMVHNLYNNLKWEENREMIYRAIDYSEMINRAINDLDYTSSLVDSTLEDIVRLKNDYMKEFSQYEGNFSSYQDTINKLNKIENVVLGNKIKIENMKDKMREKERQNDSKLKMVKKLNSDQVE